MSPAPEPNLASALLGLALGLFVLVLAVFTFVDAAPTSDAKGLALAVGEMCLAAAFFYGFWRLLPRHSLIVSPTLRSEGQKFGRALLLVAPPILGATFLVFGWRQRSWAFVIVAVVLAAVTLRVLKR